MMNLTPLPPISHSAMGEALNLLGSPDNLRQLVDSIKASHERATAAHTEATKLRDEVTAQRQAHVADVAAFESNKAATAQYFTDVGVKADAREANLERREKKLIDDAAAHSATHQAAVEKHNAAALEFVARVGKILNEIRVHIPTA